MEKKNRIYKYGFFAFAAYAALSFLWICFIATGISNGNTEIDIFASRLIVSDIFIALFSAAFGFSFALFGSKRLSGAIKRALHIIINYIAFIACVCALFHNVSDAKIKGWMVLIIFATIAFFSVYGIISLIIALVKRK